MTKIMTVTPRYAESVVAQEAASAVLNSLKAKKTDKISKMSPAVELVKADRDDKQITLQVKNGEHEGTAVITVNKIGDKTVKPEIAKEFGKLFDSINLDKFGEVVIAKANKVIETAVKVSKAAPSNPNLFRPAKKQAAKAEMLF